jgi:hypothetical protein
VERTIQFLLSSYLSLKPFPESSTSAKNQAAPSPPEPCDSTKKNSAPPPALDLHPDPHLAMPAEPPIKKGKLPETRLSKNTAPELCGRTFFTASLPFPPSLSPDFRPAPATPDSRGALNEPQTATRRKHFLATTRNFFFVSDRPAKKPLPAIWRASAPPAASRRRALETPQ